MPARALPALWACPASTPCMPAAGALHTKLLWGAPYNPKFAAVELLWAFLENRVARGCPPPLPAQAAVADLYTAWYGGETRRTKKILEPPTATTAHKFQVGAGVEMNRWVELHGGGVGLPGTVNDLGNQKEPQC